MPNFLLLATLVLVAANLVSGVFGDLAWQGPITALTFFVCLARAGQASPSRINPASLLCLTTSLFLLARFLITYFFGWSDYRYADWFLMGPMDETLVAQALSAMCLFLCGIALAAGKLGQIELRQDGFMGRVALWAGVALLPFAVYRFHNNFMTWKHGDYLAMYKSGGPGGVPYVIGGWLILCVFAYIASRPDRKRALVAFGIGLLICVLEMFKGARGIPMAQAICLAWLLTTTQQIRISVWKAALAGMALAIVADIVGRVRIGMPISSAVTADPFETFFGFFYGQGVSLIFVVSTIKHLDQFVPVVDGLRSTFSLFVDGYQRIFGTLTPGQSLDFAHHTSSLAHRISFIVDAEMYLNGKGMGGSAVAEAMLYSRLFGPLVAGLLTGLFLKWLFAAAKASPRGLFVFASTLPFFLLLPRENQLLFLVPLAKACVFAGFVFVIAKFNARQSA
jgi:hypothetical protein